MAQTGVQILFAFLLALAFHARFGGITSFQRGTYVVTLMLCAASTALLIAPAAFHCTAALSWMRHDRGAVLALGRRRRTPNAAIRRAARERDGGRCRFPGCESRRVDLHHIRHWASGGRTDLENLISLCKYHHLLVHDRGYLIAGKPAGTFAFCRPDGAPLPACPVLPEPGGSISAAHDADITPDTIIPPGYGERLDLDHAIYVCFANARTAREKQQPPAGPADRRADVTVYEPEDCDERYRQHRAHAPAHRPDPDPDSGVTGRPASRHRGGRWCGLGTDDRTWLQDRLGDDRR